MSNVRESLIEEARTRCTRLFDALTKYSDRPERDFLLKLINNAILDILNWFSVDCQDFEEAVRLRSLTLGNGSYTRADLGRHGSLRDKLKWGRGAYQWLFSEEVTPKTQTQVKIEHPLVAEGDIFILFNRAKQEVLRGSISEEKEALFKSYPGNYLLTIRCRRTNSLIARTPITVPLSHFTYEMACEILGCDPGVPRKLVADEIHRLLTSQGSSSVQFDYQLAVVYR